MAQRVADGKRIWNEPWSHLARDVFIWCLFVGSDSLGMQPESPASIAEALTDKKFKVSTRAVTGAIDELCAGEKPALIRYAESGKPFLIIRKFQDHQKIRYQVAPTCPLPSAEILERLSPKTRQLLCSNYRVVYKAATADSRATVSGSGLVSGTTDTAGSTAADDAAPECPFCRKPTKGPLQHYHDEAKRVLGRCLVIDPKACAALIAKREKGVGRKRCHDAFAVYLASEDSFVHKQGHDLKLFCSESMFNGVLAAVDGSYTHGSKGRKGPAKGRARSW